MSQTHAGLTPPDDGVLVQKDVCVGEERVCTGWGGEVIAGEWRVYVEKRDTTHGGARRHCVLPGEIVPGHDTCGEGEVSWGDRQVSPGVSVNLFLFPVLVLIITRHLLLGHYLSASLSSSIVSSDLLHVQRRWRT